MNGDDPQVVWCGARSHPSGGLLNCRPETSRTAPAAPADDARTPARRGRPPRAGERSTHRVELRLTLGELRALKRLARANGTSVADLIRLAVADLAADAGEHAPILSGRAVLDCVR
jgi:hypothetical protein